MSGDRLPQFEFDDEKLVTRLDLTLRAHVGEIAPMVHRIMSFVGEMDCAVGKEFEIEVALQEAIANAVVHGAGGDPDLEVQICVGCDEERGMLVVVRDPGPGFDPAELPSPVVGQKLFDSHGRGVFLINQLMDEVRFEKGGTEIWMRKR